MIERIYNIYLFLDANDSCAEVGYTVHNHSGSDDAGVALLKSRVNADLTNATKMRLSIPFTNSEYNARSRLGDAHLMYDELFAHVDAGSNPLFVTTPVKNGAPYFNYSAEVGALDVTDAAAELGESGVMVDWLRKYTTDEGIKTSELIHDDYFLAIKLTFNAGHYVSSMKLLVSCIDSVAYIEYGDDRKSTPFITWLDTYADLSPLGITAAELWELRNGLLHMTNYNSSAVRKNKVRRISFRVGGPSDYPGQHGDIYFFDFIGLIHAFAHAQAKWIETYNSDRSKFAKFVERYDETVSDSRGALVHLRLGDLIAST